jgi:hypothetical protein
MMTTSKPDCESMAQVFAIILIVQGYITKKQSEKICAEFDFTDEEMKQRLNSNSSLRSRTLTRNGINLHH